MNHENPPPLSHDPRQHFYRRERQSVPAARAFASATLADWGIEPLRAYDVTLCVSELATNALLHGVPPGRGYQLHLTHVDDVLRVEVHDSGGGRPEVGGGGETDTSGRGLRLVAALADRWGAEGRAPGKVVWCEFDGDRACPAKTPLSGASGRRVSPVSQPAVPPPPASPTPSVRGGSARTSRGGAR
ncbi:ATP-binding protein [Streptomyces alfalfae]